MVYIYIYISPVILSLSPLFLFLSLSFSLSLSLSRTHIHAHTHVHTHIQSCDAVSHLNVANSSLSVSGGKKNKGKKGYVDKMFPNEAKASPKQVDLGDGSFCNSKNNFFPIFIKTTQPTVFTPSNHSNIIARFISWGKIKCISLYSPVKNLSLVF